MEKKHAILISFLITLIVAGNYLFFKSDEIFPDREKVIIYRVIDGDTVELDDGRKIRLLNINAPEKGKAFSNDAADFLKDFEGELVELEKEGFGRYGRILGRVYADKYINLELVKQGLVHVYLAEENEESKFKKSEKKAREDEKGIWERSEHYGCLDVEINKKDEFVVVRDNCGVNLKSWSVKDESTRIFVFAEDHGEKVILYSGSGVDNEEEVYWKRGKVWNNDKDSIFIRDESGFLAYYSNYGY